MNKKNGLGANIFGALQEDALFGELGFNDIAINVKGVYQDRRKKFLENIKAAYPTRDGLVVLFGALEGHDRFRQESSFYYLTGVKEPGAVLTIDMDGTTKLYIPNHGTVRSRWVSTHIHVTEDSARDVGVDAIEHLGQACEGYQFYPFFKTHEYEGLLKALASVVAKKGAVFTFAPQAAFGYIEQRMLLARVEACVTGLRELVVDVSRQIAQLRRKKDVMELEPLFKAIATTVSAQTQAARFIKPGSIEYEVQAMVEFLFTGSGALRPSFPTIVGSGPNSTVLHYTENKRRMEAGDVVVIDCGAEVDYYCADLTRTYPVSGTWTDRQREVYQVVLDTQTYIVDVAKPGMWLNHRDHPDASLNHVARAFLKERGYEQYFPHGIGHFLGLDVHDVGDVHEPLQEGDVITIEPGIYIPQEKLGIRIEDNYLITDRGAECLSEELVKDPDDIEALMSGEDDDEYE